MWETWVRSLGWEDLLQEGMATHSSVLTWRIPMDRGAWQARVHQVSESDMTEQLSTAHMKGSDGLPRLPESPWHKADPGAEPEVSLGSWMSQVLGKFLLWVEFTQWREIGDQNGSSLGICWWTPRLHCSVFQRWGTAHLAGFHEKCSSLEYVIHPQTDPVLGLDATSPSCLVPWASRQWHLIIHLFPLLFKPWIKQFILKGDTMHCLIRTPKPRLKWTPRPGNGILLVISEVPGI